MALTPRSIDVEKCLKSKDFENLKQIGITQGFGTNNTIRLRCYAIFLGCGGLDVYDKGTNDKFGFDCHNLNDFKKQDTTSNYSETITRDFGRNGYPRWNKTSNYSEFQKSYDLSQIGTLLTSVFEQHSEFNYMQSFDSVFALFYLITNGNLYLAQRIIVAYLHIFRSDLLLSCNGFGRLTAKYGLWRLLKKYDNYYCKWLKSMTFGGEEDVSFVMEWYTSWFAHSSITDFDLILRLYDFMIATQSQQIGLYMVIAVLLCNKTTLVKNVKEDGELIYFVKNKIEFDTCSVNKLIAKCYEILQNEMKDEQYRNSWQFKTWKEIKKNCKMYLGIYL